jgi:hypothetical protein
MPTFKSKRGRPQKFNRPARQVTLTLPDDVIARLSRVDDDMGRAIVRLAMAARPAAEAQGAELATFGGRAVITVAPTKALERVRGVELVPLADGRALIALSEGTTESDFELGVRDLLETGSLVDGDKRTLKSLLTFVADARRQGGLTLRKILLLRARGSPRKAPKARHR